MWSSLPIFNKPDSNIPRKRPPEATPIQLPSYASQLSSIQELSMVTAGELRNILIEVHPSKWQPDVHQRLGIELTNEVALEKLVPKEFVPSTDWGPDLPQTAERGAIQADTVPSVQKLSNGTTAPNREAFLARMAELECNYEDALKILAREKPTAASKLSQLTHLRKFWMSVDTVARYWDTSKDNYRPEENDNLKYISNRAEAGKAEMALPSVRQSFLIEKDNDGVIEGMGLPALDQSNVPQTYKQPEKEELDYFGWRNATGRDMPNIYRQELIGNFVESVARTMGCHYEPGNLKSELSIDSKRFVQVLDGRIRVPVSGLVYRIPADPKSARQGWNEGPLIAVSARSSVSFSLPIDVRSLEALESLSRSSQKSQIDGTSSVQRLNDVFQTKGFNLTDRSASLFVKWQNSDVIDASKEIGALLMLAQFRSRNARSEDEVVAGKGKWWAEKRRYGGYTNNQVGMREETLHKGYTRGARKELYEHQLTTLKVVNALGQRNTPDMSSTRSESPQEKDPKDSTMAKRQRLSRESDKSLKATSKERDANTKRMEALSRLPLPIWDPRTHFCCIGRAPGQAFDHVYLISSVFHHVSILCMRIHPSMLKFLSLKAEKSRNCVQDVMQLEHFGLRIRRSRWYDLLLPLDRADAFRAIWAVMRYMMRDTSDECIDTYGFTEELLDPGNC